MSDHGDGRCNDCDGTNGNHYPGCIYDGTDNSGGYHRVSGNGLSTIGSILCVVGGLVLEALLFMVIGVEVSECPAEVLVILWCVFSFILVAVVDTLRK